MKPIRLQVLRELPDKNVQDYQCQLSEEQRTIYKYIVDRYLLPFSSNLFLFRDPELQLLLAIVYNSDAPPTVYSWLLSGEFRRFML